MGHGPRTRPGTAARARRCVGTGAGSAGDVSSFFADLFRFEDVQRSADIKGRRQALIDAGARLTERTLGEREPRRGMMRL